MGRILKWLLFLGVVAGAVALVFPTMEWWKERNKTKYLTVTASRGRVETVVNSTGTVKPVRTVSVGAFTSGPIAEIYVDFNSRVQKGKPLALIVPAPDSPPPWRSSRPEAVSVAWFRVVLPPV